MAQQGNQTRHRNALQLAKTSNRRLLHCHSLDLHDIRKSKTSIGAMEYIPMCTRFRFLVRVAACLLILRRTTTSANSSSATSSFCPLRLVLSAMNHFQSYLLYSRSLIRVKEQWIRRSHCPGPVPCLFMMLMDHAIAQTPSLT
jgi:hypothetical protein